MQMALPEAGVDTALCSRDSPLEHLPTCRPPSLRRGCITAQERRRTHTPQRRDRASSVMGKLRFQEEEGISWRLLGPHCPLCRQKGLKSTDV